MKLKKHSLIFLALFLLLAVLFWPVTHTCSMSGEAVEMTTDKEKLGTCSLSVEIRKVRSLVMDYRSTFSFVLNGQAVSELKGPYYSEGDDLCSISAMYYDGSKNQLTSCGLVYPRDLSYAGLHWNDRLYFLPNGTGLSYSELPMTIYN